MTFVLLLLATLAAAEPAAPTRIPGTKFSLGMSEAELRPGDFTAIQDGGEVARQGATKFFGVPCQVRLYFRGERLERATFEADSVPTSDMDYAENQMRHARLWRECVHLEPASRSCDWLDTVRIHLEYQHARMTAAVTAQPEPAGDDPAPVADRVEPSGTVAATAAAASSDVPASGAATMDRSGPGKAAGPDRTIVATPETGAPTGTVTALALSPPAQSAPAQPVAMAAAPAAPPVAKAAAPAAVTGSADDHVATLPDTLRISLPERNPPSVWPRMDVIPRLEFPAAARASGAQGIVWVMTLVNPDGSVRTAHVERGGIPGLNDAALAWVSQAHFAPGEHDGQPCRFWVRVAARFVP